MSGSFEIFDLGAFLLICNPMHRTNQGKTLAVTARTTASEASRRAHCHQRYGECGPGSRDLP